MTVLPGPLLLLLLPVVTASVVYLVRRWALLAALLSSLTVAGLAALCFLLPLDRTAFVLGREIAFGLPVTVLGQTLILDQLGQIWLTLVLSISAIYYLFAWRVSQGRSFFAFSLIILSLYVLTVLLEDLSLSVLSFAISAVLATFVIQRGQRGSVRGAQRYLLVTVLAVPLLLMAVYLTSSAPPSVAEAELSAESLRRMSAFGFLAAALGFGLLLAIFPFGTWMPAVAADAPPLVAAFFFTAGQAMALFLAVVFLRDLPPDAPLPLAPAVIQLSGLVMVAAGGTMSAVQRDFGRLFGYAALTDSGYLLLALGATGSQALTLALLHLVNRTVPITMLAASLAILRHRAEGDRFDQLAGMARHLPFATVGIVLGVLGLAGFPMTPGFATHWAVGRSVAGQQWAWAVILVISSSGIIVGLLRGLSAMVSSQNQAGTGREPILATMMVLGMAVMSFVVALQPQLFLERIQAAVEAVSLF